MTGGPEPNSVAPSGRRRWKAEADLPDAIRRRYYLDGRGGSGVGFYVDAQVKQAAFRDRGGRLTSDRSDPNAIRDMIAVAKHRGWTVVVIKGEPTFRREAWLAARTAGLEVRGYRPTDRDQQELEKAAEADRRRRDGLRQAPSPAPRRNGPEKAREGREHLKVVERVVTARVSDPTAQKRLMAKARDQLATLLEQGARLEPLRRKIEQEAGNDRRRDRAR